MEERKRWEEALEVLKAWSTGRAKAEDSFLKALRANIKEERMFPEMEAILNATSFEYDFDPFTVKSISAKIKIAGKGFGEVEMFAISADTGSLTPRTFDINSPPVLEVLVWILENFFELLAVVQTPQR